MKKIVSLTFLFVFLQNTNLQSSCLSCWELRKVIIELNNGERITGFVRWNELWIGPPIVEDCEEWRNKFPESLIHYYKSLPQKQEILIFEKLYNVVNDSLFNFKATTLQDQVKISLDEVKSIREIKEDSKKYEGAGSIPVYTKEEIFKLNTKPFAIYSIDDGVTDFYFLSYNKNLTEQYLVALSESGYWRKTEELKLKGIIIVALSYD